MARRNRAVLPERWRIDIKHGHSPRVMVISTAVGHQLGSFEYGAVALCDHHFAVANSAIAMMFSSLSGSFVRAGICGGSVIFT
jgi:hypothetical protein